MTSKTFQRPGGIREHVDNVLLWNKETVEHCIVKIKGGNLTFVGSKGK